MEWLKCVAHIDDHITPMEKNKLHPFYRALCICLKDFRNSISRTELITLTGRATPIQWMRYSNTKQVITLYLLKDRSTRLGLKLLNQAYINERTHGRATLMDFSRLKIGKQSFLNRLQSLRCITFNWTNGIAPDRLRINLKKTFFV